MRPLSSHLDLVIMFLGAKQLIILGIPGGFIDRVYEKVKQRPLCVGRISSDSWSDADADGQV